MISLGRFHQIVDGAGGRGYGLNAHQRSAVDYSAGPLWIIAGPGSGKSEVLVTRALKLLCVDGVEPRSVLMTTFTTKAARNLQDRLAGYLAELQRVEPVLGAVDVSEIRIGTLHSLCNDILQEFRYPGYQNVRLLDEVEQSLFIHRYADIADHAKLGFWSDFSYAVKAWSAGGGHPPGKWKRVGAAAVLFNHIVEDRIDLAKMAADGGSWLDLAGFYDQYAAELVRRHRCDFAHLQERFLDFLVTPKGTEFLDGVPGKHPPLRHVLVDEYQDTNPVQERIYLELARQAPHSLTVVGDDDQALYRFRGGTVACMVNFDKACQAVLAVSPHPIQLLENYRSHQGVVTFFNNYIASFPEMAAPGVRAPGKHPVVACSSIPVAHPGVAWITARRAGDLPDAVASFVRDQLVRGGVISDLSQCVFLMKSTKNSPNYAGPYLAAFERWGIPVYNPRSKDFMESEEVQGLLAVLVHLLDPDHTYTTMRDPGGGTPSWKDTVDEWIAALDDVIRSGTYPTADLADYVRQSNAALPALCAKAAGKFLDLTILAILYRVLSFDPFVSWVRDPVRNMRLAKVTRLFESYHSFNLDTLRVDPSGTGLDSAFVGSLYWTFFSYLIDAGIDDDEDEEVIVPDGYLPMMTIHQSKGLEFPIVIVGQVGNKGRLGAAQELEIRLGRYRRDLYPRTARTAALLGLEDDIRSLYVAYSRAEYALVIAATLDQLKKHVAVPGRDWVSFRRNTPLV